MLQASQNFDDFRLKRRVQLSAANIPEHSVQTVFNRLSIAAQTVFNQCCDIRSRPRHYHSQLHAYKWPYFRAFSRATAFPSFHESTTATGHRRASCSWTRNKKGRTTSTTAHNPISIQLTIQPTAPKIQAKSKQMYFSFFRPFHDIAP